MILGFASTENNGAIAALHHSVPGWAVRLLTVVTGGVFFWWMVFRTREKKSWLKRPQYAHAKHHNGRVPQHMPEITRRPH